MIKDIESQAKEQLESIKSGTAEIIPEEELFERLKNSIKNKKPLKVKFGVDPTSTDLHLGHAVPLRKLRLFQDLGHEVVLIIGDFTAMIGDPSGRAVTRPPLTRAEVLENAKTYTDQAFKILNKERTRIVYNSEWLSRLTLEDLLKLTSKFTVARLLERDDFFKRYKEQKPIALHEFLYPVMVAYDSVMVKCDIEMGGTDQKFNLLAGRELMRAMNLTPQICLTTPILVGIDGVRKMSKSYGNYIGLTDEPLEMFGKVMSIEDSLIVPYYILCTDFGLVQVEKIEKSLENGDLHPAVAKRDLAEAIVRLYHGEEKAKQARKEFDRIFKERKVPEEIVEKKIPDEIIKPNGKVWIVKLLTAVGLAQSSSEARRFIEQGGVRINESEVTSVDDEVLVSTGDIIKVGKRKFIKLIV